MENLNKNIVITLAFELIALFVLISTEANESYFAYWLISVFVINIVGIVLLLRFRPRYYGLSILALLLVLLTPILYVFWALSVAQC